MSEVSCKRYGLHKCEKLCSVTAIDKLFARRAEADCDAKMAMAYPWRAVWRQRDEADAECTRFLIMVPKKRLRRAVDRVRMRRLMREAYRLNRSELRNDVRVDVAFVYVADKLTSYNRAVSSVVKLLKMI